MSENSNRRILVAPSPLRALAREAYLAVVAPVGFRGLVRLAGMALIVEGIFLTLISFTAPVGQLALLTLLVGEFAFVASFVPARGRRGLGAAAR
jgi:hypothetical protein